MAHLGYAGPRLVVEPPGASRPRGAAHPVSGSLAGMGKTKTNPQFSRAGMILAAALLMAQPATAGKPSIIRDNLKGLDFRYIISLDEKKFVCSKQQMAEVRKKVKAFARADLAPKVPAIKEEAMRAHKSKSLKGIFFESAYFARCEQSTQKIVIWALGNANKPRASISYFPYMGWSCKDLTAGEKLMPCPDEVK